MSSFVCQQCKQPLELDPSLVDITPSAHDMIEASLPKHQRRTSTTNELSHLNVPEDIKQAVERHTRSGSISSKPLGPQESFVLLQDSVVHLPETPTGRKFISSPPPTSRRVTSGTPPSTRPSLQKTTAKTSSVVPTSSSSRTKSGTVNQVPSTPVKSEAPPLAPPPRAPTHKWSSALRLFTMLSSRTEVDHPLCADCTHVLLEHLHRQLDETKKERDGYIAFEREVKKQRDVNANGEAEEKALKRIAELKDEEHEAIQRLREAEREKELLDAELAELEREEKALEEEEAEFWTSYSSSLLGTAKLRDELTSLQHAYAAASEEFARLSRTNVHNDAFCIGSDGVFGTINGLRLGRVAAVPVEWSEINAAWGMTLLLLISLAKKVGLTFETYRLVPMGSFSRVERIGGDKSSYELYGSGDFQINRVFHNRRFDHAMVGFLDCLRQLMEFAESQDKSVKFPHQIVKDKIGDASIKVQFGADDAWTRALRHMLLALKILLKWATIE